MALNINKLANKYINKHKEYIRGVVCVCTVITKCPPYFRDALV